MTLAIEWVGVKCELTYVARILVSVSRETNDCFLLLTGVPGESFQDPDIYGFYRFSDGHSQKAYNQHRNQISKETIHFSAKHYLALNIQVHFRS